MTRVLLKTLLMAATAAIPHAPQTCIDPATSLQQLALQYDRWPQPTNATAAKAFELFRLAMESRQDADYNAAIRKYLNVGGNALRTSDPHEQLALGLLYLSSYDFAFDNTNYYRHSRARYNTNAERNAADLLTRLVQKDPHQWLAAIAIARMAILTRSGKRFEQARKAMQEVLRVEPGNTAVNLAWRDVLIAQDSIAAATTYLDAHPMDCAAAQHAQAENLMLSGDTAEGSRLYLEALDAAAPDELDRFYQDLLVMADRETLEQYDQAAPGLRSAWIRRYWERNATESVAHSRRVWRTRPFVLRSPMRTSCAIAFRVLSERAASTTHRRAMNSCSTARSHCPGTYGASCTCGMGLRCIACAWQTNVRVMKHGCT
jgi:tetratricopeptide (TPR) repeat protein